MATDSNQPQAWACAKCGAALPAAAGVGELVTCSHCGTPFKLPTATARSGGVSISGGLVTIGGDVIGGSKHVIRTGEAPSEVTIWDEPDASDDEGVSIEGKRIQVHGDTVDGSVLKIVQPVPEPKLGWWEKIKRLFAN